MATIQYLSAKYRKRASPLLSKLKISESHLFSIIYDSRTKRKYQWQKNPGAATTTSRLWYKFDCRALKFVLRGLPTQISENCTMPLLKTITPQQISVNPHCFGDENFSATSNKLKLLPYLQISSPHHWGVSSKYLHPPKQCDRLQPSTAHIPLSAAPPRYMNIENDTAFTYPSAKSFVLAPFLFPQHLYPLNVARRLGIDLLSNHTWESVRLCKSLRDSVRFYNILKDSVRFCMILSNSVRFCKILWDIIRCWKTL